MDNPFSGKCIVKFNEILGRYLVADKDIQAGEAILKEDPILVSPLWNSKPRCTSCFRETTRVCKACKIFPLCMQCPEHKTSDCSFITTQKLPANYLIENFSIFAPLKALLLIENEAKHNTDRFLAMESHVDKRRGQFIWKLHDQNVVNPLLKHLRSSFRKCEMDEEFLQKVCGIFDVNAFEIRGSDDGDILRAIYPNAALLTHSCVANTLVSVDDSHQMKVYATELIKTGDTIYYNYTSPLMGTEERRRQLKLGKYFECKCKRCLDPTELGTHLSSITCFNCQNLITPPVSDANWTCAHCGTQIANVNIQEFLESIDTTIKEAEGDLKMLEILLARYQPKLNSCHYFIVDLKQNIASILRNICMNAVSRPGRKVLERKIQLCDDILLILRLVEPGISRLIGIALYEKFCPLMDLVKLEYDAAEIQDDMYLERLQNAEGILKNAIQMLLYEQIQSAEGRLLKNAISEMSNLRKTISAVHRKMQKK